MNKSFRCEFEKKFYFFSQMKSPLCLIVLTLLFISISTGVWTVFSHFHSSYVDARLYVDHERNGLYSVANDDFEHPCSKHCPCIPLRTRAHADPYVFSLATNPFYLWLICTIFTEAGDEYVPKTLTQLYTWVMLVFAHR